MLSLRVTEISPAVILAFYGRTEGATGSAPNGRRIAGVMLRDLISQKRMDRLDGRSAPCRDDYASTGRRGLEFVVDVRSKRGHRRHAGGDLAMRLVRNGEVTSLELLTDAFEMLRDAHARVRVVLVLGVDLDSPAVLHQDEMMGGSSLVESHCLGATCVHGRMRGMRMLRRDGRRAHEDRDCESDVLHGPYCRPDARARL